jgi:hypothetical protein
MVKATAGKCSIYVNTLFASLKQYMVRRLGLDWISESFFLLLENV